jgi:stearoyl-CoA desaturase (Delta-9 desaturase)
MPIISEKIQPPVKQIDWTVTLFFIFTAIVGIPGGIWYAMTYGVSQAEIWLALFFTVATSMSITMGYHRCFAHVTYKAHPAIQFLLLFFGAASFQQSALQWASQHRVHHQYTDTDLDPYSIKKGFWYAHIGWLTSYYHFVDYGNVKDLQRSRMVMNQHNYYKLWAIGAGIVFPVLIGALMGHALGAFVLVVCARITFVYQSTFCINSICHMFGTATYDIHSSAKDHWFAAILTSGEGYHNFHHHFPSDYRNGVRWYHWDPTKWMIKLLSFAGLASDLKKVSKYKILSGPNI